MGHSAKIEGITRVSKDYLESFGVELLLRRGLLRSCRKKARARKVRCWLVGKKERESGTPAEWFGFSITANKDIPNYFRLANLSHEPFRLEIAVRFTLFYNILLLFLFLYVGVVGLIGSVIPPQQ